MADSAPDSESPFRLVISKEHRISTAEVTHTLTEQRVFIDILNISSFRQRSAFVEDLLNAVEAFAGTSLSAESRKTIAASLHARLLRATAQLESSCYVIEPLDELNHLAPLVKQTTGVH